MWLLLGSKLSSFRQLWNWKLWKKKLSKVSLQNHKWRICWKFQLFISLGTKKESHLGIHIWENCSPLDLSTIAIWETFSLFLKSRIAWIHFPRLISRFQTVLPALAMGILLSLHFDHQWLAQWVF